MSEANQARSRLTTDQKNRIEMHRQHALLRKTERARNDSQKDAGEQAAKHEGETKVHEYITEGSSLATSHGTLVAAMPWTSSNCSPSPPIPDETL